MSEFGPAFDFLLPHEGGYVHDPDDPGGETKFGITRRGYPYLDIKNLTVDQAREIYRKDYWEHERFADLSSQTIANKVFDLSMNMGVHQSTILLQEACGDAGNPTSCDGKIGDMTIAAANSCDETTLLMMLRSRAADYYHRLVERRPSSMKFLNGWLKRAQA